jgi:glyoxylase-like metal-dependent hydrolase (beta-lactamase superfamily II)
VAEEYQDWFIVERFPRGVTMIAEPRHYEDVKSYLVEGARDVAVLDTGMGVGDFAGLVAQLSDRDPIVLQSHGHFDHVGASSSYSRVLIHPSEADDLSEGMDNARFRKFFTSDYLNGDLPAGFDPATASIVGTTASGYLVEGDEIDLGDRVLEVFHTPGHSPGGITLLDREAKLLFPGDAIYAGPMFAYRPTSDPVEYRDTLRKLADLAKIVDVVYPSHNRVPLSPDDVIQMHEAYEQIWAGREPDERLTDRDVFNFDDFAYWLRPGAYGRNASRA